MPDNDQDPSVYLDAFPKEFTVCGYRPASGSDLGLKLKTLRELYGLSQRELAKRAVVTNSNISMIEQGQVSPSIQSLMRILGAFPMSLLEFFAWNHRAHASEIDVIVRAQELHWRDLNGLGCADLKAPGTSPQLSLQQWVLAPNSATTFARPRSGVDLTGQLLTGELQLMLATHVYQVSAGDSFYIRADQTYRFINTAQQEARLLCGSLFVHP